MEQAPLPIYLYFLAALRGAQSFCCCSLMKEPMYTLLPSLKPAFLNSVYMVLRWKYELGMTKQWK